MDFKETIIIEQLISEALKIVKKVSTEVFDDGHNIGVVKSYKIIKSKHTHDKRGEIERDKDISNEDIVNTLSKAFKDLKDGYNHVIFKSKNDKFNNIVVFNNKDEKVITVITIIQQERNKPNYFAKETDNKIILESLKFNLIRLD